MKKPLAAFAVLATLVAGWYFFTGGAMTVESAKKQLAREVQDAILTQESPEDVAALAMKAINLAQGEHGAELWRLKAEWGNMRRTDQIMELEKPRFTYYMPPDNNEVRVVSDKGEIDQDEQKIWFIENVVATYDDRMIVTPSMIYFGKTREVVCPDGAKLSGTGMEGTADKVVWRLSDKILTGLGNVDMTFENGKDIFSPEGRTGDAVPEGAQG